MDIVYIILLVALTSALIFTALKLSKATRAAASKQKQLDSLEKYRTCASADEYSRKVIADADKKSESIIASARSQADAIKASIENERAVAMGEINGLRAEAENEKSRIIAEANEKSQSVISEAQAIQINASRHATEIIESAKLKAEKISGDAYKVSQNIDKYRKEATALRNIIDGYGDRYIKPSDSVLDGLAEEFGFTEAGQELARTRALCKEMIEQGLAADSDYVEAYRRKTAINFILDAFNGKVDSILSTVKVTNVGTLEKKIDDAYTIVNSLGSAFRNTRITPEYLKERQNELRWAVAVIVLKNKQREEQRAIKERIREEERARREYEKAIREAQKQEAAIRSAIEKATQQLAKAKEEQREQYEQKLSALQTQLADAEARNQRAISMAQQTRSGHVYIISNIGSFGENVYKIGMTRRLEPLDRVRELGDASVPFPFDVHAMIYSEDAPALETELHKVFARCQVNKVNPRKEFFRIPIDDVRKHIEAKGLEVQWTLLAEASQYKESKALEESFKHDSSLETEWQINQNKIIEQQESDEDDSDE